MIIDGRSLPKDHTLQTDVCIVGAGVAGITVARELAGLSFRVCLVEAGGMKPDRRTQSLFWGENVGHPYFPLDTARCCGFGGTGNRWSAQIGGNQLGVRLRPLDELDFLERDWVPYSGWPFGKAELDPFYGRAHDVCRTGPFSYDVGDWEDPVASPRLPLGGGVETVIFQFGSREPFTKQYQAEITGAGNIDLCIHTSGLALETDQSGQRVTRLRAGSLDGRPFWIAAKVFILAQGAIEIPRLLLSSRGVWKDGIGNANDLVGRFFMEHLHLWSGSLVPSDPSLADFTGLYEIHTKSGIPIMGKIALAKEMVQRNRLLNYCVSLHPHRRDGHPAIAPSWEVVSWPLLRPAGNRTLNPGASAGRFLDPGPGGAPVAVAPPPANDAGRRVAPVPVMQRLRRTALRRARQVGQALTGSSRGVRPPLVFQLNHMTEQAPNPDSRITLSEERDPLGRNRVRLDWRLSPLDIRTIVRAQEIIGEEFRRAGLGRLQIDLHGETPPPGLEGGWHHMGTTRMHLDPRQGVVDPDCRVHGTSNLFIAGPSVFPTCGYANPVLTIVALSLRLADRIKQRMAAGAGE